jgi:hypothetical protein
MKSHSCGSGATGSMSVATILRQLTLRSDLETAWRNLHIYHDARRARCLSSSRRPILQGLRSDKRQRVELATEHDCVNFAGVADVFERIHVEQY